MRPSAGFAPSFAARNSPCSRQQSPAWARRPGPRSRRAGCPSADRQRELGADDLDPRGRRRQDHRSACFATRPGAGPVQPPALSGIPGPRPCRGRPRARRIVVDSPGNFGSVAGPVTPRRHREASARYARTSRRSRGTTRTRNATSAAAAAAQIRRRRRRSGGSGPGRERSRRPRDSAGRGPDRAASRARRRRPSPGAAAIRRSSSAALLLGGETVQVPGDQVVVGNHRGSDCRRRCTHSRSVSRIRLSILWTASRVLPVSLAMSPRVSARSYRRASRRARRGR